MTRRYECHGMWNTKTYRVWAGMIDRCTREKNRNYKNYGARGITVCQAWRDSFAAFLRDMGECPAGMTLDRKDSNGNYEPGNCRWATWETQCQNKRLSPLNRSGLPGVRWTAERHVYRVYIHANGKLNHIGSTPDFFEAACMRKSAELRFHHH